ncbi:MAG TPA: TAXI family TRAP transporter solute-binding subunit [Burkholderiaceae bacterium]|nr:TAXI family TRAP transporter solute-binding subunit [Burkholderiaceae bacterium]
MHSPEFIRKRLPEQIEGRALAWYVVGVLLLLGLLGWGLAKLAPPAPPRRIVMTTGAEDGAYHRYAQRYREVLAQRGLELELRPSAGAAANLDRLRNAGSGVDVGLVQGGLVTEDDAERLVTLGSLFYEPVWVFYRGKTIERISELRGLRIAIGIPGGGTHALATSIARDNGLVEAPTTLLEIGGLEAADALIDGRIDAALYISAIDGPAVQKLLQAPGVRLMDARRADAYVRRLPYLHKLDLPEGVIDLKRGIPQQDTTIIAVTANLIARPDIHPVAVALLLEAAREVHGGPTLLHPARVFPAPMDVDLPLAEDADRFYRDRPSWLRRVLPFWVAVWAERLLFIMLPLLAIAVPAFAYLPKLYDWRIRSKLDNWYGEVNRIERATPTAQADAAAQLARMVEIDQRLNRLKVPRAYLSRLYTLRQHADYVRSLLEARTAGAPADQQAAAAAPTNASASPSQRRLS